MRLNPRFIILACAFIGSPLCAQPPGDCEGANGSQITLEIHEPQYSSCGQVSINGYVGTEQGEITSIHWDWGDENQEAAWFPAAHTYASNGTYSVNVTAVANGDTCQQKKQQVSLNITNVADDTCDQSEPHGFDVSVLKSVDNPTPSGLQQTVEFTVEVRNTGDVPANDVVVEDKLPPELSIPEGMAAFTSRGYYDASSGRWEVGELEPGLPPEILTLPVVITPEPQPVCVVNTATSNTPGDINTSNDSAFSTLRRPDIARCVDLGLKTIMSHVMSSECEATGYIRYQLEISNAGPDIARHVVLEISETDYEAPGFIIHHATGCDGLACTWETLDSGQAFTLNISSETFQVQAPTVHGIKAVIAGDLEDYNPANNTLAEQLTIQPFSARDCNLPSGGGMDFSGVGGGSGCFIATAIYSSADHPDVKTLRDFRDNVLLKTGWGRALIEFYYRHSPDLACYIGEHDSLRVLTRGLLTPVVLAVAYPWQALAVLIAAVASLVLVWRRAKA